MLIQTLRTSSVNTLIMLLFVTAYLNVNAQPDPYPASVKVNYVRTWETTAPITDPAQILVRPLKDVKQTTQYFDGLGRPFPHVIKICIDPVFQFNPSVTACPINARRHTNFSPV